MKTRVRVDTQLLLLRCEMGVRVVEVEKSLELRSESKA